MKGNALRIEPAMPVDLGEPMSAREISDKYLKGKASARWVRGRFPLSEAIMLGNSPHWFESFVIRHLPTLRGGV